MRKAKLILYDMHQNLPALLDIERIGIIANEHQWSQTA
jgi:hypothetical protein